MFKIVANVEGMMCGNCERHVNEAIEKNFDVKSVVSSHAENKTEITAAAALDEAAVKAVIEEEGYTVKSVTTEEVKKKLFGIFG